MKYLGIYISSGIDRRSTVSNRIKAAYRSFYSLRRFFKKKQTFNGATPTALLHHHNPHGSVRTQGRDPHQEKQKVTSTHGKLHGSPTQRPRT